MNRSLILIDQIIEMAKEQDKELCDMYTKLHKSTRTIGDSAVVFYLARLRELLVEESKVEKADDAVLNGKTFSIAYGMPRT